MTSCRKNVNRSGTACMSFLRTPRYRFRVREKINSMENEREQMLLKYPDLHGPMETITGTYHSGIRL